MKKTIKKPEPAQRVLEIPERLLQRVRQWIDEWGKYAAIGTGVLYAVGLIVQNLYLSDLHIRSLDLIQAKYILVGLYYAIFVLLTWLLPAMMSSKSDRTAICILEIAGMILMDNRSRNYLGHLVQRIIILDFPAGSNHYYSIETLALFLIIFSNLVAIPLGVYALRKLFFQKTVETLQRRDYFALLLFSMLCNFLLFYGYIFRSLPEALGGGRPTQVEIFLAKDTPDALKEFFNKEGVLDTGRSDVNAYLIYNGEQSLFFKKNDLSSSKVYEIDRSLVNLIQYSYVGLPIIANDP
jgi:hypothetical protein